MIFRLVFFVTLLTHGSSAASDVCKAATITTIDNYVSTNMANMASSLYDVIIVVVADGYYSLIPPSEQAAKSNINTQQQMGELIQNYVMLLSRSEVYRQNRSVNINVRFLFPESWCWLI